MFSFLIRLDLFNFLNSFNSLMICSFCFLCRFLYISPFKFFNFCLWWCLYTSSTTLACFFLWMYLKIASIMLSREYSFKTIPLIVNRWIKSLFFNYLTFLSNLSFEMEGHTDLPLFFSVLKYSDFVISKSLSISHHYIVFKNKLYKL